jgi:hypothetical protein
MSRSRELQKWMAQYKFEQDSAEFEVAPFVDWLIAKGVKMPTPPTPKEMMAKEVSRAAREEKRHDEDGQEYRANLAVHVGTGDERQVVWVDIDKASRNRMEQNSTQRRDQIVGDVVNLVRDVEHWNKQNPTQLPLFVETDFGFDLEMAKAERRLPKAS